MPEGLLNSLQNIQESVKSLCSTILEFSRSNKTIIENLTAAMTDLEAEFIARSRMRLGVPLLTVQYNQSVDIIYSRLQEYGFSEAEWNSPAPSQLERMNLLKDSTDWREGYLLAKNGDLKYSYIDATGIPRVSGIRSALMKATLHQDVAMVELTQRILAAIK